jgi:hypothetical protein
MANGRPWFVRYANGLGGIGVTITGPFDEPFQPSNELEELNLEADPLMYKKFYTKAAAEEWINSKAGQTEARIGKGPASAATAIPGISSVTDFLKALTQRNTLLRLGEGAIGIALIIVGVAKLADGTPLGSVLKKVPFVP